MTKRVVKRIAYIAAVLVLLLIIAGASAIIWYKSSLSAIIGVKCSDNCEVIKFTVPEGSGASSIADSLEKAGVIKSALAFKIYLNLEAENKTILPGEYEFKKDMSVKDIVKQLNEGVSAKVFRITFLPGETIAASKSRLLNSGYYTQAQIDEAFSKSYTHPLLASKPDDASLEGYSSAPIKNRGFRFMKALRSHRLFSANRLQTTRSAATLRRCSCSASRPVRHLAQTQLSPIKQIS